MADYKRDSDGYIDYFNEEINHFKGNNKDNMQYIMAAHLFNKFFIYFLMAQNTFLSNKGSIVQYFILDQYAKTVFQSIIPDISAIKVLIAKKNQFKSV